MQIKLLKPDRNQVVNLLTEIHMKFIEGNDNKGKNVVFDYLNLKQDKYGTEKDSINTKFEKYLLSCCGITSDEFETIRGVLL